MSRFQYQHGILRGQARPKRPYERESLEARIRREAEAALDQEIEFERRLGAKPPERGTR